VGSSKGPGGTDGAIFAPLYRHFAFSFCVIFAEL
jgi:hypothetical protein